MKQSIGLIALFIFVASVSLVLSAQVQKQGDPNAVDKHEGAVGEAVSRIIQMER